MPLQTLGMKLPGTWYGLTKADVVSVILGCGAYYSLGIYGKEIMQWLVDYVFFGSVPFASVWGVFVLHKSFEWGILAFWSAFYYFDMNFGWFNNLFGKRAKINPDPFPQYDTDERVRKAGTTLQNKSFWYIVKFHICVAIVQFLIWTVQIKIKLPAWEHFSWDHLSSWTSEATWEWLINADTQKADPNTVPDWMTLTYQCLVSTAIAETGFYWAHRWMHETSFYRYHKLHHEYVDCNVWATFYVTVFDMFVTDIIPAGLGPVLFNMHMYTMFIYTIPLILNASWVHAGYDQAKLFGMGFNPFLILPFATESETTHDLHHRLNNCNYGGAYFAIDRLFGTYINPEQYHHEKALKEAAKKSPKEDRLTKDFGHILEELNQEDSKKTKKAN